jgi:hypothetical protein
MMAGTMQLVSLKAVSTHIKSTRPLPWPPWLYPQDSTHRVVQRFTCGLREGGFQVGELKKKTKKKTKTKNYPANRNYASPHA